MKNLWILFSLSLFLVGLGVVFFLFFTRSPVPNSTITTDSIERKEVAKEDYQKAVEKKIQFINEDSIKLIDISNKFKELFK
jgi:hypothetical protein